MSRQAIVRAGHADVETLSQVVADAFGDLAPGQWLIEDATARREIFPRFYRIYVDHAMANGMVFTTVDRTAAALWVPVGLGGPEQPDGFDERVAEVTGQWAERFMLFEHELDGRYPTDVAYHYLAILAVRPDRQGQGIGTALLDAHHAVLDQEGIAAYLEASDERTRGVYLRHGYADYGSPVELPGGPFVYPMLRHPRTAGDPRLP
jgi:GNAT superfamily N-acetyltransferase